MKDHRITLMYLISSLDYGGAEQQLLELLKGIDKTRFRPLLVSLYPGGPLEPQAKLIPGVEIISVNRKGKYDFWVLIRILSLLRQKHVDIIQPFLTPATFFGLLPALINHTPVKIVTERSGTGLATRFGHKIYQKLEDSLTRYADWVVPNSEEGKRYLVKRGIDPTRIKIIYNGLNLDYLTPDQTKVTRIREQLKLPSNGKVVGIAARLSFEKDHATFLQGAKIIHQALPQTRFAILGDGPLRSSLENMSRELDIETFVTFFGHQHDIASYTSCFDVACLCSNITEGCPMAVLEAMVLKKPVVATNVGGTREVVENGKTGLIIPTQNPKALADSVLQCLRQPDLARELGESARKFVLKRFNFARFISDYEQLYEQTMRAKERG
jgi:glycosyltransferase involved in cell wall biosynthesis